MEQRAFNVPARLDYTCSSLLLGPGTTIIGHGPTLELVPRPGRGSGATTW